jgi:PAS domain S-box-containing protein
VVETATDWVEFQGRRAQAVTVRDASGRRNTDLELREATERFRLAFDGAPIGMALVAPDGRWLQVNAALCEIVGYSAEELLPMTFQDITHPDDLDADLELVNQVLVGEIPGYSMEKRYFHADGHVVWINLSVSAVRDPAGAPLYFISQIEDVTERRRASAELALAEERFRALVEFAPEATVIIDDAGMIRLVNRQSEELFGYERDVLYGCPVEVLLPERVRGAHQRHRSAFVADPRVRPMGLGFELQGRRRDGTEFPVEISLSPLETSTGRLVSAAIRDVTERKRMEAALRQESANVRLLERVAVAANEASSVDDAYAITLAAVCAHTGLPVGHIFVAARDGTDQLVSSGIWRLEDPVRFEAFRRATEASRLSPGDGLPGRALETAGAVWGSDIRRPMLRSSAGRELGLKAAMAFPVLVGHEIAAIFEFFGEELVEPDAAMLDVVANVGTQLGRVVERARLAEQQVALDEARAQFVANAAHELRTPLATMRAVAGLLGTRRSEMTEPEIEECFDMLERQGENLEVLVRDLLDLSQIEHEAPGPPSEATDVAAWIAVALQIAPPPSGVNVEASAPPGLGVLANGDRLTRVLVNLLTNAYRYGGSTVTVSARRDREDVLLLVEDDGDGVPASIMDDLFEPFTRGGSHEESGAGLGLAICRRIVEHFGGTIAYESGGSGGAGFVVRLQGNRPVPEMQDR